MDAFDFEFFTLTAGMVGLFFICCAIVQKKPKQILEEHFGVYDGGLRHVKTWVFKRNQLVLGFALIVVACILKIFGHAHAVPEGQGWLSELSPITIATVLVAQLIALCALLYWLCRSWSKRDFKRIVTEVCTEHAWPFASNLPLAIEIGTLLGVQREEDDTVEAYLRKLRTHLDLPEPPERGAAQRSRKIGLEFR